MRRPGLVYPSPASRRTLADSEILGITSLVAWFDMQAIGTYTVSAGLVASISNRKTGVAAATALTAAPVFDEFGWHGRPCMLGGTRGLAGTEAAVVAAMTGTDTPLTVIAVAEPDAVETTQSIFGAGNSGVSNNQAWRFGKLSVHRWYCDKVDDAGASVNLTGQNGMAIGKSVVAWMINGITGSTYPYNGLISPSNGGFDGGATTPNRFALLARPDSGPDTFWGGRVAEVLVFAERLELDIVQRIMRYEQVKWGLV